MSPRFIEAFGKLEPKDKAAVGDWLENWRRLGDPQCAQVAINVENEMALDVAPFRDFLSEVAQQWRAGGIDLHRFDKKICEPHHRKGRPLDPPEPKWVGRVEKLTNFLFRRQKAEPGIATESLALELALASTDPEALPPQAEDDTLPCVVVEAQPVEPEQGRVFTAFPEDRSSRPFDINLRQRKHAISMLGLGLFGDAWALAVTYQPRVANLTLHVPTICDAGSYDCFRPAPAAAGREPTCGRTYPLAGCTDPRGMPEAVHRDCGWLFLALM